MAANHGRPRTPEQIADRFWSKVERRGPNECWPWTAAKHPGGYGTFWNGTRLVKAHRHSWELVNGPVPEGKCICHRCDNPPCVNPAHLFHGSHLDNRADAIAKGRHVSPPHPHGEGQHLSKLTEEGVRSIRSTYRKGDLQFGARALAQRLGVTKTAILLAIKGKTWKHVTEAA